MGRSWPCGPSATGTRPVRSPACPQPGGERAPLGWAEGQGRPGRVLGVPDRAAAAGQHGDFDAVAAVPAAVAALAPGGAGQVHRSSATFLIRSREAPRGSASARNVSKVSLTFTTTDDLWVVCP